MEEEAWGWAAHGGYGRKGAPCNRAVVWVGEQAPDAEAGGLG